MEWIPILSAFIIGAALAGAGVWFWMRSQTSRPLSELKAEHQQLKDELTDHFVRTSEKVEELSESYRAVMAELRDGASHLVDQKTLIERLGEDRARRLLLEKGEADSRPDFDQQDDVTEAELVEPPRY